MTVLKGCKPKFAKEDIVCYKIVGYFDENEWQAIFRGTLHKYDMVLKTYKPLLEKKSAPDTLTNRCIVGWTFIDEGFHAYSTLKKANFELKRRGVPSELIVKCTIPKGAMYCYGELDHIVANQMIVHKPKCVK